jgi:RAD51-like protein 2
VLDSVAFHFRRGFTDMALRARLLTSLAQALVEIAHTFKIAVNKTSTNRDRDVI